MSLPEDFLKQLEQYSELSKREKEVFLEIFGLGKSRVQVTQALNISDSNLGSCLTGIYKKFCININDNGPGKENRLWEYLSKRYAQYQRSGCLTSDVSENAIDTLVEEIREQVKANIKERCGIMQVLDMTQPIELTGEQGIYTNVNILEKKITEPRRPNISKLLQNFDPENFEQFGPSRVAEKGVPRLEAVKVKPHSKLMVFGKPGAGKTIFLKYLAMQCIEGHFQANRVPLFITLKDFAETPKQPDVLEYIVQKLSACGVTDANVKAEQLLRCGKALILLDGLDEVREEDTKRLLRQIREVYEQFHTNQFVITCRIAANEYTFERFTKVEVADFDELQIAIFAQKWFRLSDQEEGEQFIQTLKENEPIQELATNPLLLTQLCLKFKGSENFPVNRSELYSAGLDVLLKKWDAQRCVERDQVDKKLSVQRKQDLLSHIALTTFEQKNYFFEQGMVERYIADFMRTELQELELDSEAVLKSIEAQHGLLVEQADRIYSFSHLTFHEYFTARWFVERADVGWQDLVNHVTEKHWREVFLIAVEIVNNPEQLLLLMKQKIDKLIADIDTIQEFLKWVHEEALRIQDSVKKFSYKPAAIRAFNLARALELEIPPEYLKNTLLPPVNFEPSPGPYGLLPNLCQFALSYNLSDALDLARISTFNLERGYWLARILDPDLAYHLHQLLQQLEVPNWDEYEESVEDWWSANGQFWTEKLRTVIVEYRNFGHNWQFSNEHQELLKQYYDGNQLLVDCLNSDCYVSREIEETLLLPMVEIEKRQK